MISRTMYDKLHHATQKYFKKCQKIYQNHDWTYLENFLMVKIQNNVKNVKNGARKRKRMFRENACLREKAACSTHLLKCFSLVYSY